jgi:purine-nucleoside phosphorylase
VGFSCITNLACGLSNNPITHAEVLETTERVAGRFRRLVAGVIGRL